MNRIIKFRAWDKKKKSIIYDAEQERWHDTTLFHEIALKDYILMQFTGLLDKNGKEIYEGDIVEEKPTLHRWYIDFYSFGFKLRDVLYGDAGNIQSMSMNKILEVIGNIYESPKLLK